MNAVITRAGDMAWVSVPCRRDAALPVLAMAFRATGVYIAPAWRWEDGAVHFQIYMRHGDQLWEASQAQRRAWAKRCLIACYRLANAVRSERRLAVTITDFNAHAWARETGYRKGANR